jgi:hypothetical protein
MPFFVPEMSAMVLTPSFLMPATKLLKFEKDERTIFART